MDRVYSNRLPGQRRIHIEINPTEIADLLADLGDEGPYDHPATDTLVDLLTAAHALFVEDEDDARAAARQATGQADTHCPACEAGIEHTDHCPTPETHNWGCGCPTDNRPVEQCGAWGGCILRTGHTGPHRHTPRPVVGQPAATPDTDQAQPARDDLYDALDQSWYRWGPPGTPKADSLNRLINAYRDEVAIDIGRHALRDGLVPFLTRLVGKTNANQLLDVYRAVVIREAADAIEQAAGDMTRFRGSQIAAELRRMAEEARS